MPLILRGIEIGEGFWHPEVYKKARSFEEFDVVIGSVHQVRHPSHQEPYSQIDFSSFSTDEIEAYLYAYFTDVLELIETTDFDVLAHLSCPLRYIVGKYDRQVELSRYRDVITKILKKIIKMGIALEVNTSAHAMLGDWMPPTEVLKLYRELGGYLITLGSDAHIPGNASANFEKALKMLASLGFSSIYYYKHRRGYQLHIGKEQL